MLSNIHDGLRACFHEVINLFIKPQHFLLMGLYLVVFFFNGLLMVFHHFVCKLLLNMRRQHIAAMSSEVFCPFLLTWSYYLIHLLFIGVIVIFPRVLDPIDLGACTRHLDQLTFMREFFKADMRLIDISSLGGPAVFKCPTHFPSTCPRLSSDGHNVQFYCIKVKCHHRKHLY